MRHWGFVGRADELIRLRATAARPEAHGLVLSGVPGIGKSRLLREAADALPADELAVHHVSANVGSSGLPFGGLAQILPPDPPDGLSAAGLLRWAVDTLQAGAGDRPVVLAVDDAHLLDPPSAALVHLLVLQGATLLGTLRTGEPVPGPISALWTEGLVGHAELTPLNTDESRTLLTGMLGAPVDPGSAQRLTRLAGGNPLLLRELVLAATGGGEMSLMYGVWRWTGRHTFATSLADLADARIGGLTPGVREVLELVALGEPIGLPLLLRAGTPADVEAAEERGLIRVARDGRRHDARLAHPLYGEVARQHCAVTRSRRLLATLADLVESTGARRRDDLLRLAVWRLDSGTAQDGTLLLDAAVQAFGRFDLPLALRLAQAARDAGAGYAATELLATTLLFADRPDEARAVLDAAEDAPQPRLAITRATVAFWGQGDPDAADELAAAGHGEAHPRAVEALMRLQLKQTGRARTLARGVLDDPAAGKSAIEVARCVLAFLSAVEGDPDHSAELLAGVDSETAAWRRDTPALHYAYPMTLGTRVCVSLDLEAIDEILAAEFADLARTGGFGFGSGWAALLQAHSFRLRGRPRSAVEAGDQACAALASHGHYDGNAHASRAHSAALAGDRELATRSLALADAARGTSDGLFYAWSRHARVWTTACGGDVPGAVRLLQDLLVRLRTDGLAGHELLALHDLVRLGRPEPAAERMRTLLATCPGGRAAGLLLRHARAAADASAGDLLAVARDFRNRGYLMFAAEAAATAVKLFRTARDPQAFAASTLLADVLDRCETIRTPALRSVQPTLTVRELQVAQLAADGVKSREIADRLFLSPRTVENHLQRVYAKLGVTGRTELAPALRSLPQ